MATLEVRESEPLESQYFIRLRACRNLHERVALERGHFNTAAEDGRHEIDGKVTGNILPFSAEVGMGFDRHGDIEVALRAALHTMLPFIGEPQAHAGFDTAWNIDRQHAFLADALTSTADLARFGDDLSDAFALTARAADAEESLLETQLSLSFTGRTHLDGGRGFCAGAFTVRTGFPARNFELGFLAEDRLFEGDLEIVLKVIPALGPGTATRLTKEVFENVVEDIAESTLAAEIESLGALRSAGVAECIVPATFVRIADDLVGFVQLFEFLFGRFLLLGRGMQVRVMLASEFSEGLLLRRRSRSVRYRGFRNNRVLPRKRVTRSKCNRTKPHRP